MGEKIGSGRRFQGLAAKLNRNGVRNPAALAAAIGRKKYGAKRMAQLAQAGKRRAEAEAEAAPETPPKVRRVRL